MVVVDVVCCWSDEGALQKQKRDFIEGVSGGGAGRQNRRQNERVFAPSWF